jgi:hypothetical protein
MRSRFSRGDTARLYLDIIVSGAGQIGEVPLVAIRRLVDGWWFQDSDDTWQSTRVANTMTETDSTNLPGRYHYDFNQSLDPINASSTYIAMKWNVTSPAVLEYEDLVFGTLAGAANLELCSVQGTVVSGNGYAVADSLVRATLIPIFKDALGRVAVADRVLATHTDVNGDFDLPLIQGGTFRLEIPAVGYDRKVLIPAQSSVLFTAL